MSKMTVFLLVAGLIGLAGCGRQEEEERPAGCDNVVTSIPAALTAPGSYCLSDHLMLPNDTTVALDIQSDDVTIDGKGFCIRGSRRTGSTAVGVQAINRSRIRVNNLCVDGFFRGLNFAHRDENGMPNTRHAPQDDSRLDWYAYQEIAADRGRHIRIDNVTIRNALFHGIYIDADDFQITNSGIYDVGGTVVYPHSFATAIYAVGNFCLIDSNTLFGMRPVGTGEGIGIALYEGQGCTISNNTVLGAPDKGSGQRTFAIWVRPAFRQSVRVLNNHVSAVHYGMGPWGIYRDNVMSEIFCDAFINRSRQLGGGEITQVLDIDDSNKEIVSNRQSMPCIDDLDTVIGRANASHTGDDAYRVALAYAEKDPVGGYYEQAKWLMVAAALGHPQAQRAVATYPQDVTYRDRYDEIRSEASAVLESWGKTPEWPFPE